MTAPSAPAEGPVVVKLGGSLITRKREVEKLRPKVLARVAREVVDAGLSLPVVLHGAGSFGHPSARRFRLAEAPGAGIGAAERLRGAAIVSAEVRRLHLAVLRALVEAGGRPFSVPVSTHALNREGRLVQLDARPFAETRARGLMPVAFGDVVPDEAWGYSILSADTIATALVPALGASRVIFATDVPGVLEAADGGRRAVRPDVGSGPLPGGAAGGGAVDVTGGIRGKVEAMRAIAAAGADAGLISGLTDGALSRAIRGEAVYGSWARARPAQPS